MSIAAFYDEFRHMDDEKKKRARDALRRRLRALGIEDPDSCDPRKTLESAAQFYREAQSGSAIPMLPSLPMPDGEEEESAGG